MNRTSLSLWSYYGNIAETIASNAMKDVSDLSQWESLRPVIREQFFQSIGLDPLPPRPETRLRELGTFSSKGYEVRRIAYQILPDCWASACVYLPDSSADQGLPAVLYVCGHKEIGIHGYQDHAAMWARRGYVCLIVDTVEQHDNPGDHHGLYYGYRHDWISMGYTGAGGELWNSIRALDVLASMPELDPERIGATGISGGGAHSFFLSIADDRVKAVASACGVATPKWTLQNRHLLNHCDCMYFNNPYQRDTCEFGAVIAPRPIFLCFASEDSLFSREEYYHLAERLKRVYALYGNEDACCLYEYPGGHGYCDSAVEKINDWFDRHVAGTPHPPAALKPFEHSESTVSVFNGCPPTPNRLRILPELLCSEGSVELPHSASDWRRIRSEVTSKLRTQIFPFLAEPAETLEIEQVGDWVASGVKHRSYRAGLEGMALWIEMLIHAQPSGGVVIGVAHGAENARDVLHRLDSFAEGMDVVAIEPRGTGYTAPHPDRLGDTLRAGALVGCMPITLTIRDLRAVIPFIQDLPPFKGRPVYLAGRSDAGIACVYHALFDEGVAGVIAEELPATHLEGGYILMIMRVLDLDHAIGLLAPRPACLVNQTPNRNRWAKAVYRRLGCAQNLATGVPSLEMAFRHVRGHPTS